MRDDIILSIKDLNLVFHDHDAPETAVESFSLDLKEGEIVGLVGESGSGKSLTALAVAGLISIIPASVSHAEGPSQAPTTVNTTIHVEDHRSGYAYPDGSPAATDIPRRIKTGGRRRKP